MALPVTTQVLLGLAIAGSGIYMISAGDTEGVLEYIYVDKFVDSMPAYAGRTVKVHGTVVPGTVLQKIGAAGDYTFEVEREGRRLPVHFTNMVPDTFAEGGEVVLTGELLDGRFESEEMAAKCPSKYEEQASADPTKKPGKR
jgi:cytochrome c-type biogenesis protein CcmE